MKIKLDNFVLAIIVVIILAYFFPQWGSKDSPVPINLIGSIGISMIFFFYGLKLSPEKIRNGLRNWKLHILVQASTFFVFPLLILAFFPLVHTAEGKAVWLAFLFLAALPSTVSSSVVMVSIAKGNIPAAIFNASISGLLGILLTPLWMGLFLTQAAGDFDLGVIYIKLLTEILLPVIIGISLQRFFGKWVQQHSKQLSTFDKSIILLIIYKSFAESFEDRVFSSVGIADLLYITLATTILFYLVYFLVGFLSKKLGFDEEDRITALFCGSKKSLIHGTVFSKILFPAAFPIGIILLPLMIYHAIQIFIISIIASRIAERRLLERRE
jgi:sodium/bile acid cotransporter 7